MAFPFFSAGKAGLPQGGFWVRRNWEGGPRLGQDSQSSLSGGNAGYGSLRFRSYEPGCRRLRGGSGASLGRETHERRQV